MKPVSPPAQALPVLSVIPVLRYLIDITGHLDRRMIDCALTDALRPLSHADEVTIFELSTVKGQRWMRQRAGRPVQAGGATRKPGHCAEPVANHPALATCIEQHAAVTLAPGPGHSVLHWMPIWRGEQALSCLCLLRELPLSADELAQVDGILEIYKNFLAVLDYSEKDSLTGLLNRKTFDQQFSELMGAIDEGDAALPADLPERRGSDTTIDNWLAVIDIDHFKQVNDRYGHLYGDEVLILLANLLKQAFREQDRVYRFGGEEFVVLLRSTNLENARRSFERLRQSVDSHRFPQIGHVTISVGFVSIGSQTPVTILGQADQALYFAKQNGRNRICFYDELVASGELGKTVIESDVDFF